MSHTDRLGINVFNGAYPERIQVKPKALDSIVNRFKSHIFFNSVTLTRYRFLYVMRRQRAAIASMDELTQQNLWLKSRHQLMRKGFKIKGLGCLFGLFEPIWQAHWQESLSANVAWAAFLMLKGCAVKIRETEQEKAILLCACTAALLNIPVHWVVSDEHRVITLVKKYAIFFQALGIESPVALVAQEKPGLKKPVVIITAERLARDYLADKQILGRNQGHLGLLLQKLGGHASPFSQLQKNGLCLALIENIDFWLLEKAFATVEINQGEQQITLHELFSRHLRCAGNLLSPPDFNQALWSQYKIVPIDLWQAQKNKPYRVSFCKNLDDKWALIAKKWVAINQANEKACLIVTTSESLEHLQQICQAFSLPSVIVKEMHEKATKAFQTNNLLVLVEPFPWLGLAEWLNHSHCQLIIVDFCDSLRILHHLEHLLTPPFEMIFSLEDNWLQKIDGAFRHFWLKPFLSWRKMLNGKIGNWLLRKLLTQVENKRQKLNHEMSRWLWQKERMFSFFKK